MNRGLLHALGVAAVLLIAIPMHLRGAKPLPDLPASATFRCAAQTADCRSALAPDRIRGDGQTYDVVLNTNRELQLSLQTGGGRTVWLDFTDGPPRCTACRRTFDTLFLDNTLIQTNVVDALGNEVTGGLLSIPVGGTSAARLKVDFSTLDATGQSVIWAVRFNPESYPGSDHVMVTRTATNTWQIEATNSDRALLVSSIFRKNGTQQQEGPFYMLFKITVVSQYTRIPASAAKISELIRRCRSPVVAPCFRVDMRGSELRKVPSRTLLAPDNHG
jgi:hypothetical protein